MARILPLVSSFFLVALLCGLHKVDAAKKSYGKVTCSAVGKVPDLKLLGTFAAAKCKLPTKYPAPPAELGNICRKVWMYIGGYKAPNTFDKKTAYAAFCTVFPSDYHASLKQVMDKCMDGQMKTCKSEADDKSGASWHGMYQCFENWWNTDLCNKK